MYECDHRFDVLIGCCKRSILDFHFGARETRARSLHTDALCWATGAQLDDHGLESGCTATLESNMQETTIII